MPWLEFVQTFAGLLVVFLLVLNAVVTILAYDVTVVEESGLKGVSIGVQLLIWGYMFFLVSPSLLFVLVNETLGRSGPKDE